MVKLVADANLKSVVLVSVRIASIFLTTWLHLTSSIQPKLEHVPCVSQRVSEKYTLAILYTPWRLPLLKSLLVGRNDEINPSNGGKLQSLTNARNLLSNPLLVAVVQLPEVVDELLQSHVRRIPFRTTWNIVNIQRTIQVGMVCSSENRENAPNNVVHSHLLTQADGRKRHRLGRVASRIVDEH